MGICRFDVDTFTYNVESNLKALGLPMPTTVAGSAATVAGAISTIESALTRKAADMSLAAIAQVGLRANQAGGVSAAFWVGAVIGSAMMASTRATSCSRSELIEAFKSMGLSSWMADAALNSPNGDKLLRLN